MNKKIEIQVPEGKVAEWKEINGVTTLVLAEEKDNRPVTERIKTFEDAVKALVSSYLELSDASLHLNFEQAEEFERVKDALKKAVSNENVSVGDDYLTDWYIHSIDNEKDPVWTEKHIQELCNDFILIPKR